VGTKHQAPQAEGVFCTGLAPEHAGLLEAATDDGFAASFDDAGADKKTCLAEAPVVGSGGVALEVIDLENNGITF
jgi:hypothetical protein